MFCFALSETRHKKSDWVITFRSPGALIFFKESFLPFREISTPEKLLRYPWRFLQLPDYVNYGAWPILPAAYWRDTIKIIRKDQFTVRTFVNELSPRQIFCFAKTRFFTSVRYDSRDSLFILDGGGGICVFNRSRHGQTRSLPPYSNTQIH